MGWRSRRSRSRHRRGVDASVNEWQEVKNALIRTAVTIFVPASVALWLAQDYSLHKNLEALGIAAISLLAVLGIYSLLPHVYHQYGRLTIVAFVLWAASSVGWRVLYFLEHINSDESQWANTLVAIVLDLAGIYVFFLHSIFLRIYRYLVTQNH